MLKKILFSFTFILIISLGVFLSVTATKNEVTTFEPKLKDSYSTREELVKDAEIIGKKYKNM